MIRADGTLAPRLASSTGLSVQGVELALAEHLELKATDDDLAMLVKRAGDASRVAVVLSANVFVGALRAIALARAASIDVVVRPSRREPVFARELVGAIRRAGDTAIRIDESFDVASMMDGEIHVYGRDETIQAIRSAAVVRVRGHGSGMGIAWISPGAEIATAAHRLASDVTVFDQRGCLSPRIVLVGGGETRVRTFARALHEELEHQSQRVPRGQLPAEERAESERYIATMVYSGDAFVGSQHVVGVASAGTPLVLPPTFRHVHVVPCKSREDGGKLLLPLARGIVCVGSDDAVDSRALAPAWARIASLGAMQRPPLDGPVDLREQWS